MSDLSATHWREVHWVLHWEGDHWAAWATDIPGLWASAETWEDLPEQLEEAFDVYRQLLAEAFVPWTEEGRHAPN